MNNKKMKELTSILPEIVLVAVLAAAFGITFEALLTYLRQIKLDNSQKA